MPQLQTRASAALRWNAFWNNPDRYGNYVPYKQTNATLFSGVDEAILFVPDVRDILVFGIGSDQELQLKSVEDMGEGESIDDAMRRFLQYRGPIPEELRRHAGRFGAPPSAANGRALARRTYSRASLTLSLPELSAPDYIQEKRRPEDLPEVVLAVREAMADELLRACGTDLEAIIPYFGADDPVVYVYVRSPNECRDVLLELRKTAGGWKWDHQFSFEPEPRSWTGQQVLRHPLKTVQSEP